MAKKYTLQEVIDNSKSIFGDILDYSKIEGYTGQLCILKFICKIHNIEFTQTAKCHLRGYFGCSSCVKTNRKIKPRKKQKVLRKWNLISFTDFCTKLHNGKYDYSSSIWQGYNNKIKIICFVHGIFEQNSGHHIEGRGCLKCGHITNKNRQIFSLQKIIKEFTKVHGLLYDYSLVIYNGLRSKIKIICRVECHGIFEQIARNHLNGSGCPKCRSKSKSKSSLEWLDHIKKKTGNYIQHHMNDGEFCIPETKYKADGYCRETNTIYEFLGDYWHGNPKKFNPKDLHPTKKITYDKLHRKTINRENEIRKFGYNYVSIWESDWNLLKKEELNKYQIL